MINNVAGRFYIFRNELDRLLFKLSRENVKQTEYVIDRKHFFCTTLLVLKRISKSPTKPIPR